MAALSARELERGLLAKGFMYRDNDHRYLLLCVEGKITNVGTKVSYGAMDYSGNLLGKVKRDLRLRSETDLVDFVRCRLSYDWYVKLLRDAGVVF